MPFTLSHPAAIIPLHQLLGRRVSVSAMAIGSMSPDFAYFLPGVHGLMTHSLAGIVSFCLPAGLLAYFIFHLLIKRPASLLLPVALSARLRASVFAAPALPAISLWRVACSVMLGAATHIAWDALTHRNTIVVSHIEFFRSVLFSVDGYSLYLYKLLQHLSTAFGLLMLGWWIRRWIKQPDLAEAGEMLETGSEGGLALVPGVHTGIVAGLLAAALVCSGVAAFTYSAAPLERWLFHVVVASLSGFMLALLFYCLAWHSYAGSRRPHES
ncbi:MAG: DUF4184 family protein [Pseudomonadota bacterium]